MTESFLKLYCNEGFVDTRLNDRASYILTLSGVAEFLRGLYAVELRRNPVHPVVLSQRFTPLPYNI